MSVPGKDVAKEIANGRSPSPVLGPNSGLPPSLKAGSGAALPRIVSRRSSGSSTSRAAASPNPASGSGGMAAPRAAAASPHPVSPGAAGGDKKGEGESLMLTQFLDEYSCTDLSDLKKMIEQMRGANVSLSRNLELANTINEDTDRQNKTLGEQVKDLEKLFERNNQRVVATVGEKESLESEKQAGRIELNRLGKELEKLTEQLEQQKRITQQLEAEKKRESEEHSAEMISLKQGHEKELKGARENLAKEKTKELEEVHGKLRHAEKNSANTVTEMGKREAEISRLNEDLTQQKTTLQTKELEINELKDTISSLLKHQEDAKKAYQALANSINDKYSTLEQELTQRHKSEVENLVASLGNEKITTNDLKEKLGTAQRLENDLRLQLLSAKGENKNLLSELSSMAQDKKKQQDQLEDARSQLKNKDKDHATELERLKQERKDAEISIIEAQKIIQDRIQNELNAAVEKLESSNANARALNANIELLTREKERLIRELEQGSAILTRNKELIRELQNKIRALEVGRTVEIGGYSTREMQLRAETTRLRSEVSSLRIQLSRLHDEYAGKVTLTLSELKLSREGVALGLGSDASVKRPGPSPSSNGSSFSGGGPAVVHAFKSVSGGRESPMMKKPPSPAVPLDPTASSASVNSSSASP